MDSNKSNMRVTYDLDKWDPDIFSLTDIGIQRRSTTSGFAFCGCPFEGWLQGKGKQPFKGLLF